MGGLVLLSLVLITLSFRSSALDGVQGTAADVLRPFEVAANRVSRPFRDAAGWAHGLVDAKSQNAKLRRQIESLRQQVYVDESALQENVALKQQLNYLGPADDRRLRPRQRRGADGAAQPERPEHHDRRRLGRATWRPAMS